MHGGGPDRSPVVFSHQADCARDDRAPLFVNTRICRDRDDISAPTLWIGAVVPATARASRLAGT
jgi:hypothetical protein